MMQQSTTSTLATHVQEFTYLWNENENLQQHSTMILAKSRKCSPLSLTHLYGRADDGVLY